MSQPAASAFAVAPSVSDPASPTQLTFNIQPRTVNDILLALRDREEDALLSDRRDGQWVPVSATELFQRALSVASALQDWGIGKGDRVSILSENRSEWMVVDFAILMLGAVVVPIYATQTPDQVAFVLQHSGARVVFVSSADQLRKVESIREQTAVERVVVMDEVPSASAFELRDFLTPVSADRATVLEEIARSVQPEDLATIIYTSGTTGTPKGARLTHGNLSANICCSLGEFGCSAADTEISFLPLSHITALHVDYAVMCRGMHICYCPDVSQLNKFLLDVRPTFMTSVPRVYEKVYQGTQQHVKSPLKQLVYRWAMGVGRRHLPEIIRGEVPQTFAWRLADKLLFSKVKAGMGGRVRILVSGGAPLGRELAEWFATIGMPINQGYGLTETSPVISVNTPTAFRLGSSGKPLPNVEVKIAEDGEILARGPSVFSGYWQRDDETREAFVNYGDGGDWFKTGDIGHLDADGFLFVTDRKKNLIKTSGGKYIAPQPIENSLKHDALIAEAVVIGDRRKFPCVLIVPNFDNLKTWAAEKGVKSVESESREKLVTNPLVFAHYEAIVAGVNANLARFERMKKVLLVTEEPSPANGMMTTSMKLKRRAVEEHFQKQIDELYARAEAEPHE